MNPIELLEQKYPLLTRSEQTFADFVIQNPAIVIRYSLTEIAKRSNTSNTAIIRLCQKLGYQGFSEFKFSLSRSALSDNSPEVTEKDSSDSPMHFIISQYIQRLNQMASQISRKEIRQIASLICHSRRLAIMGFNRTGLSASQLSFRLSKLGVANHLVTDRVQMQDYMELLGDQDTCIIFSITTNIYHEIAQRLNKNGATLVLFTMNAASPIKKLCDHFICLPQISYSTKINFLDDQALFFIFIEILLNEVASMLSQS